MTSRPVRGRTLSHSILRRAGAAPGVGYAERNHDDLEAGRGMQGGNLQSLRQHNRASILAMLQRSSTPLTMGDLREGTGLSRPTIESLLQDLLREGLVTDRGLRAPSHSPGGGRPPRLYAFDPTVGCLGAVVLGIDDVQVALADLSGRLLGWRTAPLRPGELRREIAYDLMQAMLRSYRRNASELRALTVGIMGVHTTSGAILRNESIPELSDPEYFTPYREALSCPLHLVNDAYLAALAQYDELCADEDVHSMIGLHASTAIGCGIIVEGELYQGHRGAAAEMGFARELGWTTADSLLRDFAKSHDISPATVFSRAAEGAKEYASFVGDFIDAAMPGIRALLLAFDPQILTIGGALAATRPLIEDRVCQALSGLPAGRPDIRYSRLREEAIITGAIRHGVRAIEGNLDPSRR